MRYFIGFLVTIGLIILLIILLVGGGGDNKEVENRPLSSYANTDAVAIMTVDGIVNSAQIHQQIRISVDKDQVRYERIRGYDGTVEDSRTYDNSTNAYTAFLKSLAFVGFAKGETPKGMADERGYCPLGSRYIFELSQGSRDIQRFWSTSCNQEKTYLGNRQATVELFRRQVPDFNDLSSDIDIAL
jgi:hypothetical protein